MSDDVRTQETCEVCGSYKWAQGSYIYCPMSGTLSHYDKARAKGLVRLSAAPGELVSAVEFLYDEGELTSILDLIHFIEKPHKYPELLALWEAEQCRQGELQDERQALA